MSGQSHVFNNQFPIQTMRGVSFCTYTADEVRQLSVMEVTNPLTFDALGHPTKDGLYDPRLGPTENFEVCTTCRQPAMRCQGHMGHITLPLPIFNPLFIRVAFQLLRGTCFSCCRFRTTPMACQLVLAQLKALNYGLVHTAKEMEAAFGEMEADEYGVQASKVLLFKKRLDQILQEALEGLDSEMMAKESVTKNVVECRHAITRVFMREHIANASRKCFHCQTVKRNISMEYNSRMIIGPGSKKDKPKKKMKPKQQHQSLEEDESDIGGMEFIDRENLEEPENSDVYKQVYLTPKQAREHLQKVYQNEKGLMTQLFGALCGRKGGGTASPIDGFFLDVLPVPPSRFRPLARMGEEKFENPQSTVLNKVVQDCFIIKHLLFALKSGDESFSEDMQAVLSRIPGKKPVEKLQGAWFNLQAHANAVFDGDLDKLSLDKIPGVKQILERKNGLFRMHMMGKRVNYAARSVISPDPYIDVDEIGVPEIFAKKLTYPQPVTPWNVKELRQAVCNGPNIYPGAALVKNENGATIILGKDKVQREAIAKQLLTPSVDGQLCGSRKIVYRHLRNGDILLLNRQPSLHKPSIMAHKARVLPGEKTLRLNYSNCKTYNADFDGDEMNAHFPQSELARAEAYTIANVNHQYLVPKDGTPLGGLIQDHIIAATLLMIRGKFFTREDYQHLVFGALIRKDDRIKLLPPAIQKPATRWSGKQVISTVIINTIPAGKLPLSLQGVSKISIKCWQKEPARPWLAGGSPVKGVQMTESEVVIRHGELLCGILDKAHVGPTPYSMIHCCYELYGGEVSGQILSQLTRLFTHFLQIEGFTLGVEDILVTPKADGKRRRLITRARKVGDAVACEALRLPLETTDESSLKAKLAEAHLGTDDRPMKELDMFMKVKTDGINNDINNLCMPDGLLKKFPENNLQLMVLSGAKGSTVNCMQISCLLGQIELEGRRPPLMLSGRSLPSFQPYDTCPRAGGFVDGRFLTGIRPQEYYFHCMAGREGLIDTAVKTSRSGYLQRCLIKHLEGIVVAYDLSVRDSDGSIIQFQYGEDALDILKLSFLKEEQFPFLVNNANILDDQSAITKLLENCDYKAVLKQSKKVRKWLKKRGDGVTKNRLTGFLKFAEFNLSELKLKNPGVNPLTHREFATEKLLELWKDMDATEKIIYNEQLPKVHDPVSAVHRPDRTMGAISERLDGLVESYIRKNKASLGMNRSDFRKMMHHKILTSVCEPGEAVGLLAAQSIGEPSTQMTLNTFHFAGRGEMNVTLGIPRLREILMTASANIATPSLEVPFLPLNRLESKANKLRKKLSRVYLSEVVESILVKEKLVIQSGKKCRIYTLLFQFFPHKMYKKHLHVEPARILHFMETVFIKHLLRMIKIKIHVMEQSTLVSNVTVREKLGPMAKTDDAAEESDKMTSLKENAKEDEGESSDEEKGLEQDATDTRNRARHDQDREYEELDEEEKQIQDQGMESDDGGGGGDDDEVKTGDEASRPTTPTLDETLEGKTNVQTPQSEVFASLADFSVSKLDAGMAGRVAAVIDCNPWIMDYKFDTEQEEWCELTFGLDISLKKVDLNMILKEEVKKAVVHHAKGINKAFIVKQKRNDGTSDTILKTDGVNITEVFKYDHLLDLRRIYSNDIHSIAQTYGIEVATRVIVKEIQNVFRVYGIEVDPRHLLLIADYMTFDGAYKPFNRMGMESSASPLQQMSFETTMHFLKLATLSGISDSLKSPSSRLVVGRPVGCGTGSFDLIQPLQK